MFLLIKRTVTVVFLTIMLLPCFGQQHDYFWILGEDNGGETNFIEGNSINFRVQPIHIQPESLYLEMHSTMASICDAEGNLQFYTNGCKIANKHHQLMENGEGINPGAIHDDYCINEEYAWRGVYPGGKQSALILPQPGTDSVYYFFHKAIEIIDDPIQGLVGLTRPMYYTVVDMRENNGAGRVIEKNTILLEEDMFFGQLTAVKHANGQDWWVITPAQENTSGYFRFLLTDQGVSTPSYQEEGMPGIQDGGWSAFSPDGNRFARYHPVGDDLFLFDFDRKTGLLNNFQQLLVEEEEEWVGSVAFSPSSRFLYVSSFNFIYQYDTWADDIAASRITIAEYEPLGQFIEQHFWGMQLTPDCRIFVFCNSCDVIHVIHNPDEPGLASNFEQGAVQLAWPIFRSQPHFPNYRLGAVGDEGLPCSPIVSVQETIMPPTQVRVFPNPANNYFTLSPQGVSGTWLLYDSMGRLVQKRDLQENIAQRVPLETVPSGMYFWKVVGTALSGKVIKQ